MRWLVDENFHRPILKAIRSRLPSVDIITVQEAGLRGSSDAAILDWAAQHQYILITQDSKTLPLEAYERMKIGLPMPGVIVVPKSLPVAQAIEELESIIVCGVPADFDQRVLWLPL